MVALIQQRQRGPGEAPLLLDRLVRIGVAADVDRLAGVVLLRQLVAEDLRQVDLGEQLRLEVQAGGEVEVAVRGAGVAIDATAFYGDLESVHFESVG